MTVTAPERRASRPGAAFAAAVPRRRALGVDEAHKRPVDGLGGLFCPARVSRWDRLDAGERFHFDPTGFSLNGIFLAQLAVGVLGVLVMSSEYTTGQIRATLSVA